MCAVRPSRSSTSASQCCGGSGAGVEAAVGCASTPLTPTNLAGGRPTVRRGRARSPRAAGENHAMARRSTKQELPDDFEEHVLDIDVGDEMRSSFLEYAYSVIYSRALPDARDGLKPVQRR